jgi:hypothetical protein
MITQEQVNKLKGTIYALLMDAPDMDMGDMTNCLETAELLVNEWIESNNITVKD